MFYNTKKTDISVKFIVLGDVETNSGIPGSQLPVRVEIIKTTNISVGPSYRYRQCQFCGSGM